MSRTWTMIAGLALATALAACGGTSAESAAEDLTGVYNDMAAVLEGIDDVDSLEAARSDMRDIAERMNSMRDDWEALAEDGDPQATWDEGMTQDLMEAQQRMTAAMMKVAMDPALAQKFSEVMLEFGDAFDQR